MIDLPQLPHRALVAFAQPAYQGRGLIPRTVILSPEERRLWHGRCPREFVFMAEPSQLEPMSEAHASELWTVAQNAADSWKYLRYGPFAAGIELRKHLAELAARPEQPFWIARPAATNRAEGWLSHMPGRWRYRTWKYLVFASDAKDQSIDRGRVSADGVCFGTPGRAFHSASNRLALSGAACNSSFDATAISPSSTVAGALPAQRDPVVADDIDTHEWVLLIDPAAVPP